jgi:ABC-type xylose transport system substrate-binding protein
VRPGRDRPRDDGRLRRQQLAARHDRRREDEASKCPSVTSFEYADGQGDTQKAIADIQGMVAKGVDALVVFPDAGEAILPALRSAYKAGVVTVPYRVTPGGKAGEDYDAYIDTDFTQAGKNWGNWIKEILPDGGNVLMLSGPKGNSQGVLEAEGLHEVLDPTGKYTFIGEQPFEPTAWDPAETQKVLTSAIAKYDEIDVVVSDFGPSLVGALPEFQKSGRSIPALATSTATRWPASTRRTRTTTRTSSSSPSPPRTTTPAWRSSGRWPWPRAARSRLRPATRRSRSRTRRPARPAR